MDCIPVATVASLAGVSRRAMSKVAMKALTGPEFKWRGASLIVRKVRGIGGKSGLSYQVQIESLPLDLQLAWKADETAFERPLRHDDETSRERNWWIFQLQDIAQHKAGSKARGAAIDEFSGRTHLNWNNNPQTFTARTIRRKLAELERGGLAAVSKRHRRDIGMKRVRVTREFDAAALAAGVSNDQLEEVRTKLTKYIRSLIAASASRKIVTFNAEAKLNSLAEALGITTDDDAFKLPDHLIQSEAQFKKVARFKRDRKAHDDARPRISRSSEGLSPMDLIMGDIHPADIVMKRPDGSTATARLIAWYDCATHRAFLSPVLCEAGTGIRNSHVIQSFIDMVRAWGLPKALYLDNGSEYNWPEFIADALKLAADLPAIDFAMRGDGSRLGRIIRAKAYNAAAKGAIEGFFRNFEGSYLCHLKGYIGGDRLCQKVANVGRAPAPFDGTIEKLSKTITTNLSLYNSRVQTRRLKGISPDAKFREFVEAGWTMTSVDENTLRIAFSEEQVRKVTRGRIQYAGQYWICDELKKYQGKSVVALIPKYERWDRLPLKDEKGGRLGFAFPDTAYGYLDPAGAIESARREKLFRSGVRELEQQIDKVDVQQEIESNIVRLPPPVRAPIGATLSPSDMAQEIITGMDEPEHERKLRKMREIDRETARYEQLLRERDAAREKFK